MTSPPNSPDSNASLGKARPRGSQVGLIARQASSVERTRKALDAALAQLLAESPSGHVTKKSLCKLAGLKSTVALHSEANGALLKRLLDHNTKVASLQAVQPAVPEMSNRELRVQLVLRDAEVSYLLSKNQRLQRQLNTERKRSISLPAKPELE